MFFARSMPYVVTSILGPVRFVDGLTQTHRRHYEVVEKRDGSIPLKGLGRFQATERTLPEVHRGDGEATCQR